MQHLTPTQLAKHIEKNGDTLTLLDVREPWEFDTCHISGSTLMPMGEVPGKLNQLGKDQTIAVICHHGRRSLEIARFLEHNGFQNLINLTGGIDAWAVEVDLDMPKY